MVPEKGPKVETSEHCKRKVVDAFIATLGIITLSVHSTRNISNSVWCASEESLRRASGSHENVIGGSCVSLDTHTSQV
jgi:hypothetical protein